MSIVSLKGDGIQRNPSNQKELVAFNNNNVLRPQINIGVFEDLLTQKVGQNDKNSDEECKEKILP